MSDSLPPLMPGHSDAADRSLVDDVRQLFDDGRTMVEAEIAYQTSRAAFAGKGLKGVVAFGALGAALVFFALIALTVGLVIALTPWLTALGAAGAVFAGFLIIAFICMGVAASRWKVLSARVMEKDASE
jgi:hypothetical protein